MSKISNYTIYVQVVYVNYTSTKLLKQFVGVMSLSKWEGQGAMGSQDAASSSRFLPRASV